MASSSVRLSLLRTKYKPGRKLSAYYVLTSVDGSAEDRHAAVTWTVTPTGTRTALWLSPEDDDMPQLQRLTDARHVAALAAALDGHPLPAPQGGRMRTVRYRPGQRHVLVTDRGWDTRRVYVKTDRDRSGANAVEMAGVVQEAFDHHLPAA